MNYSNLQQLMINQYQSTIEWIFQTRSGLFVAILLIGLILLLIIRIILIKRGKKIILFTYSIWKSIKQPILENQEVQQLSKKYKRTSSFIKKRLNKKEFFGYPFTLISIALLYVLALFGGIVEDIINSEYIVSTDIRVANLLAIFRNEELTRFFLSITLLGKWQVILIFTIATILILNIYKKRTYIIPLLISIAGSELFTIIGKVVFHRARPDIALYTENSYSFPSGHATIAVSYYGFIAYLLVRKTKKWKYKINIFFGLFITILLIGFSRLYLGVHYVSDVWGGFLAGLIWLIIAISLVEFLIFNKDKKKNYITKKKKILSLSIISISLGIYLIMAFQYQVKPIQQSPEIKEITISDTMTIFKSNQLKYTETLTGQTQEPMSFIIQSKSDEEIISLFNNSGWDLADDVNIHTVFKTLQSAILKESYPNAPMTPSFWNAQVHNFGFEKETEVNNARSRHHTRFWKTNYVTETGEYIYVGTASFDSGFKWGITHKIAPDIDTEREFLYSDLSKTNMISNIQKIQFVNPTLGTNFSGDPFFTDGKLYILSINKK